MDVLIDPYPNPTAGLANPVIKKGPKVILY